ncbi:MAG TPA: serine hydrolase domain-containing protein [Verrucomicrobiae bacterium]|jgi:N-acyl-D-amino-acid deacylase
MNRRHFIKTGTLALAVAAQGCVTTVKPSKKVPLAQAFDHEMNEFMEARKVPGGALAVVKDGRLVYARGYGWADRDAKIPVKADSLFRIASVTKPLTAAAVMKLVEEEKLALDTKAFPLLNMQPAVMSFRDPEPRLRDITIRQLLQHTGGWDRDKSFDPMFRSERIATATNSPRPATAVNVIRYMLSRELDFDPGTRYAYSNYGYCVLGRLIEKLSGQTYEEFVRKTILAPIGINQMRIGASLDGKQAPGEVRYYAGDELADNVFPGESMKVPWPYGGFHLEAMDAHGGWIASAVDLARFAAALHDSERSPLLKPETFAAMYAPPPAPVSRNEEGLLERTYYGCGWMVRPKGQGGRPNYWHSGSLPGTSTLLVRRGDGLSWVALFNQRSEDKQLPDQAIDPALHRAAARVEKWPDEDLFSNWK